MFTSYYHKRIQWLTLLFLTLLLSLQPLHSISYTNNDYQAILESDRFTSLTEKAYNGEPIASISKEYELTLQMITSSPYSIDSQTLAKARASLILGRQHILEDYCRDHSMAKYYLDIALEELDNVTSDNLDVEVLLLKGEIFGAYFLMDERKHLFSYGMKSNNITQDVWKKAPDNPRVMLLKANQLLYTPKLFGGDLKKSKELFLAALEIDLLPGDAFTALSSLGIISSKEKDRQKATTYLEKALDIYPNNQYAKDLIADL